MRAFGIWAPEVDGGPPGSLSGRTIAFHIFTLPSSTLVDFSSMPPNRRIDDTGYNRRRDFLQPAPHAGDWAAVGRRVYDSDRRPVREAGQDPVGVGAPVRSDHLEVPWEPGVRRQSVGEWCSREPPLPPSRVQITPPKSTLPSCNAHLRFWAHYAT